MIISPTKPLPRLRALAADALASLVVFLVALPLCMGIAIASGAPVSSGIIAGIIGGILVGLLGGAPFQVSGPAAGLTVVCAEAISRFGPAGIALVVLLAGAIQLLAGACRLGQWFRAISPAVVHGMLAGIGVLIVSSQLHVMVDDRPRHGALSNLLSIPEAITKGLPIPAWENHERRQMRLVALQQLGNLHQRQSAIVATITRLRPDATDTHTDSSLIDLAVRERHILEEVQQIHAAADRNGLPAAELGAAQTALSRAIADLESPSHPKAAASVPEAHAALAAALAELKNHDWAAKIGVLSILIIVVWQTFASARLRVVPGPLLAVLATTGICWVAALPVLYVELPERFIDGISFPDLSLIDAGQWRELLTAGLVMAVIASAETLLCATAVDRMQPGAHTDYDRELAAQGLGNILCGLVGGLPITGVIVRSAANVQAGARTKWAAVLHGIWLLLFVTLCGPLLQFIPTAALAGILVYTGFRLIDYREFARLWNHDRSDALIMLTTLVVIVADDLLVGVVTGFVLSAIKLLIRFTRVDVRISSVRKSNSEPTIVVQIAGAATFLRLPVLADRLDTVPQRGDVQFEISRLAYLDEACLDLLQGWIEQREAEGQHVAIDRQRLELLEDGAALPKFARLSPRWSRVDAP